MTVRILTAWNGFPAGFVGEVRAPDVEEWLVNIGFATRDLGDEAPTPTPEIEPEETRHEAPAQSD